MANGNKINVTFLDFDVEPADDYYDDCTWDFLEISYGITTNMRYCGNLTSSLPGPFITCNNVKVKFVSDDYLNFPGFRAVWSLVEDVGKKI